MNTTRLPDHIHILAKRLSCVLFGTAVLAMAALTMPALAQPVFGDPPIKLDFPTESPGIPAYARLELLIPDFDVPNNDDWAAIVFYRDPDCIPLNFDLGQFFHPPGPDGPGAFGCRLLIEGSEFWANGPGQDLAPVYVRSRNAVPNLPVWFVDRTELDELFEQGMVFIDQIEALPSLIQGRAWWFEESLHPNGSAPEPAISLTARGRLETGGLFSLDWHFHANAGEDEVEIKLELDQDADPAPPSGPVSLHCLMFPHLPPCNA